MSHVPPFPHPHTAQELASRLARYYGEAEAGLAVPAEGPFAVSFEDALPLDDFFEVGVEGWGQVLRSSGLLSFSLSEYILVRLL